MKGKQFVISIMVLTVLFIFVKIYQQNRTIKVRYELQRIERECGRLQKVCNQQNIVLSKLKDPQILKQKALAMGFVPMRQNQFVFTTTCTTV